MCREVSLTFHKPSLQHQIFKWLPSYPSSHLFPPWFACRAHKREVKVRLSCWSQELEIEMEIAWLVRSVSLKAVCYSTGVSYADVSEICINAGKKQLSPQLKGELSPCTVWQVSESNGFALSSAFNVASLSLWPVGHSCSEILGAQLMAEHRIFLLYPLTGSPVTAVLELVWEGRDFSSVSSSYRFISWRALLHCMFPAGRQLWCIREMSSNISCCCQRQVGMGWNSYLRHGLSAQIEVKCHHCRAHPWQNNLFICVGLSYCTCAFSLLQLVSMFYCHEPPLLWQ